MPFWFRIHAEFRLLENFFALRSRLARLNSLFLWTESGFCVERFTAFAGFVGVRADDGVRAGNARYVWELINFEHRNGVRFTSALRCHVRNRSERCRDKPLAQSLQTKVTARLSGLRLRFFLFVRIRFTRVMPVVIALTSIVTRCPLPLIYLLLRILLVVHGLGCVLFPMLLQQKSNLRCGPSMLFANAVGFLNIRPLLRSGKWQGFLLLDVLMTLVSLLLCLNFGLVIRVTKLPGFML